MRRTLALRRETLTELGTDALAAVAGADGVTLGCMTTPPAPRTLVLEECFAISVHLNCGDITRYCSIDVC